MAKCVSTPNILWKIENFASLRKQSGPSISFMGLKFLMSISRYMEAGYSKLQLVLEDQNFQQLPPWQFSVDVYIVMQRGTRYMAHSGKYTLAHNEWRIWTDYVSTIQQTVVKKSDVTFLIMITPGEDFGTIINAGKSVEGTKQMTPCTVSFSEDIGNLFNNNELSDFTLTCGDRKFFVHKAILSTRSRFFDGMFRHDMKEVNEKEGKIEKMEPDILEVVLRYLYTGELESLPMDSIRKVYAAADRFIVEPLKIKCHSLLFDAFITESKTDLEKITKSEQPRSDEQSTTKEVDDTKERHMLKNLFMSREWRLFSEEFPLKAFEMSKPYLLQEL